MLDGVSRAWSAARDSCRATSIIGARGCAPPNTRRAVRSVSSSVATASRRSSSVAPVSTERGKHFQLYYERDLALMRKSKPQLRRLCAKVAFDLVLIDGNEYTGWGEFERVRDECKPRYVALHDTGTLKTAKVEAYLETHTDEYRLLLRKGETDASPACDLVGCLPEGLFAPNEAGWAIYQRSDYS